MGKKFSLVIGFFSLIFSLHAEAGLRGIIRWFGGAKKTELSETKPVPSVLRPSETADEETRLAGWLLDSFRNTQLVEEELRTYRDMGVANGALLDLGGGFIIAPGASYAQIFEDKLVRAAYLRHKLAVAILGGTKSGKSTIFNSMVEKLVSQQFHVSGATKIPVIALHPGGDDVSVAQYVLGYPNFQRIERPEQAVEAQSNEKDGRMVLWHPVPNMPQGLLLFDLPDFDSTEKVHRLEAVKGAGAADIIIAVITPQKHGDEAVREFFSENATELNKPVLLIINQVPEWSMNYEKCKDWRAKFVEKSGLNPFETLVVPTTQTAAEAPQVPGNVKFIRLEALKAGYTLAVSTTPFAVLKTVDTKKMKSDALRGAITRAITGPQGINDVLNSTRRLSEGYAQLKKALSVQLKEGDADYERLKDLQVKVEWPPMPPIMLEETITRWWKDNHRMLINKPGAKVGDAVEGVLKGVGKFFSNLFNFSSTNHKREYEIAEFDAVRNTVGAFMDVLRKADEIYPGVLSQKSIKILTSNQIEIAKQIIEKFQSNQDRHTFFQTILSEELPKWDTEHPGRIAAMHVGDSFRNLVLQPACFLFPLYGIFSAGVFPFLIAPITKIAGAAISGSVLATGTNISSGLVADSTQEWLFKDLFAKYASRNYEAVVHALFLDAEAPLKPVMEEIEWGMRLVETPNFTRASDCASSITKYLEARK